MESLTLVIILLLIGLLWLDGARARELATRIARGRCRQSDVQFLDGTVSLKQLGLRWGGGGLRLRRRFQFDYSMQGVERRTATLVLIGTALESLDLGLPQTGEAEVITLAEWRQRH